jgi:hypothetical protein
MLEIVIFRKSRLEMLRFMVSRQSLCSMTRWLNQSCFHFLGCR